MGEKNNAVIYGEIVSKCWNDENFKKKFVADPESVLADAGFKLEEGVTYKVIDAPKGVRYVVIPCEGAKEVVQKISAGLLSRVESDEVIVPEGIEIRLVQNTDDTRYLILPASPKTLTAAELKAISGGDLGTIAPITSIDVQFTTTSAINLTNSTSMAVSSQANTSVVQAAIDVVITSAVIIG